MCLRFVFLLTTRTASWLRLSRREETWKTAKILILRHQLTVLQRRQPRRPNLTWADRALLTTLLSVIPKARRQGLRLLITPDTILRWHRDIVRRRQAARSACGRTGRSATRRNIRALVRRLARENPHWGYRRIHGELAGLGVKVAASTVWEILKASGIDPGRRQTGPTWSQFLRSQAEAILACDFFTVDLLDGTQAYVLAVIEHATRRIRIIGITLHPTGEWTTQQARNLVMDLGEQAHRARFMIRDRGSNFTIASGAVLADAGIRRLCSAQIDRSTGLSSRRYSGTDWAASADGESDSVREGSARLATPHSEGCRRVEHHLCRAIATPRHPRPADTVRPGSHPGLLSAREAAAADDPGSQPARFPKRGVHSLRRR
jgi:putative transposase